MTERRSRIRWARWPILVIAAAVGLVLPGSPAAAATGSGGGTGTWVFIGTPIQQTPPCAEITSISYNNTVVAGTSTYEGTYVSGTRAYAGPLTVTVTNTETGYGNPTGTYQDEDCETPGSIGVHSEVRGNFLGTSVACTFNGEFQRVGTHAVTTLNGSCTVTNATGSTTTSTTEVRNSELVCTPLGPPPLTCTSVDTYVAAV